MKDERAPGSTQKELLDPKRKLAGKYAGLCVGKKGLAALLKYEFVNLFIVPIPGALGLVLRRAFFPWILGKVGRGVVFGRNVVLRHPHKIEIGDNTFIDDGAVLDAKGEANEGDPDRGQRHDRPQHDPDLQGRIHLSGGTTATSRPTAACYRRRRSGSAIIVFWPGSVISWPAAIIPSPIRPARSCSKPRRPRAASGSEKTPGWAPESSSWTE
jgi:hypothetical protein